MGTALEERPLGFERGSCALFAGAACEAGGGAGCGRDGVGEKGNRCALVSGSPEEAFTVTEKPLVSETVSSERLLSATSLISCRIVS